VNKLPTILAGAGLALATLGGALTATAAAATPPGGTVGDTSGTLDPGPRHQTGSANLDRLANALALHNKSVTAVVRAPAGLQLTRPVDVVAIFGTSADHVSRAYSNAGGLRLAHDFAPGDGRPRREPVVITLTERDPLSNRALASYVLRTGADVLALWDVIVNPLRVTFWDPNCDLTSDADPRVGWYDAAGVLHLREFDPDPGDTVTIADGFSGIWHEAKASDPLFQPSIGWAEGDLGQFNPVAVDSNLDHPLLPTESQDNQFELQESGGDCSAHFSYSVSVTLRTYPGLPS
jgi:hypothetical protein